VHLCADTVLILCWYCTYFVLILCLFCADTVPMLRCQQNLNIYPELIVLYNKLVLSLCSVLYGVRQETSVTQHTVKYSGLSDIIKYTFQYTHLSFGNANIMQFQTEFQEREIGSWPWSIYRFSWLSLPTRGYSNFVYQELEREVGSFLNLEMTWELRG
jgi:hypothetical protein